RTSRMSVLPWTALSRSVRTWLRRPESLPRAGRRRWARPPLHVERLEDRTLLTGSFGSPVLIALAADGSGNTPGTFPTASQTDIYQFTAPKTIGEVLQLTPPSGGYSYFAVLDSSQNFLTAGSTAYGPLEVDVTAGQSYFLETQPLSGLGSYS